MIGINNNCNVRGTSSTSTHREPSSTHLSVPRGSGARATPPRGSGARATPPNGRSSRVSSNQVLPNPFEELVTEALQQNVMQPGGIRLNNLRQNRVPVQTDSGNVDWFCAPAIACDLGMTNADGSKITCRNGSTRCTQNHKQVCRFYLNGTCRFGDRCTLPHWKLWCMPVTTHVVPEFVQDELVQSESVHMTLQPGSYAGAALRAPVVAHVPIRRTQPPTHVSEPESEPRRTHTQLCKSTLSVRPCKFGNRCLYAHKDSDIRPTREVERYTQFLADPVKYRMFFEELRSELVRLSEDAMIVAFYNADKSDISLRLSIPGPDQLAGLLIWWGNLYSRVKSMNAGKLDLPTNVTEDNVPSLDLFPEDGPNNLRQDIAWVLISRMKICTKENCEHGINCRSGVHGNINQVTTDYLEGKSEPNSTKRDAMARTLQTLLATKETIKARRAELRVETVSLGFRRANRDIEKDQTLQNRLASNNERAIADAYLKVDFEEWPKLTVWTGALVVHVNREIVPSDFSVLESTPEMIEAEKLRIAQDLIDAPKKEAARILRLQIYQASKTLTKLCNAKLVLFRVKQAAQKFITEYQRKLCEFQEKWDNLGIELTVVVSKDGETSDINERCFDSDIKKIFYNAEDWMNNRTKWSNKKFVGTFSDVVGDSDIVDSFESSTYSTFVRFVETSPRVAASISLMRKSGRGYTVCSKYISTDASARGITIDQFAVDSLNYTEYIKHFNFFTAKKISFEKFSTETKMYCAYALSDSDVSFEEFLASIKCEEGFTYVHPKKKSTVVSRQPTELDAKTYKKLSTREPIEGYWYVDGVQVAKPVTEEQIASYGAIQKLRTAQCITDIRKYYDIVAKTYTLGKIMDDAKSRLEKHDSETPKKSIKKVVANVDSDSDSESESESEDEFDFGPGKFEDQMPEPDVGSYQGLRGYSKPYYLISTSATGKSFAHFGPFKTKEEANTFRESYKKYGSKKLSTSTNVTRDKDEDGNIICYNVSLNVTASKKSAGNLDVVIAFLSKCATNSGILGNQVAVQYIKQSDRIFHHSEDETAKSLVEIEMNRLHKLLPKVAVYDSDSDDE